MRVRLEGVHESARRVWSKRRGCYVTYTYYYAWRGGPKLEGKPGSPEFVESYRNAHKSRRTLPTENVAYLIDRFTGSDKFDALADASKRKYLAYLKQICEEFGTMPFSGITDFRSRRDFAEWHASMSVTPRSADYALSTLQALLTWAVENGFIEKHHANHIRRLHRSSRADIVWSEDQIARIDLLPDPVARACRLALWTGQRQGDLLRLMWSNVHADHIMLTQSKAGARVFVFIIPALSQILKEIPRLKSPFVLNNVGGEAWKSGFIGTWRKGFRRAGIEGVTFHDLRGTFENRLWQSGCTEAEAYSITGRSMKGSSGSYYQRSKELSRAAMLKLESTFGEQANTKVTRKLVALERKDG